MLADLVPETRSVAVGDTLLTVRALSIGDIGTIAQRHAKPLSDFMASVRGEDDVSDLAFESALSSAPNFVAELIALAVSARPNGSGETDVKAWRAEVDAAAGLPAGVQIEILVEAWALMRISPAKLGNVISRITESAHAIRLESFNDSSPSA